MCDWAPFVITVPYNEWTEITRFWFVAFFIDPVTCISVKKRINILLKPRIAEVAPFFGWN